MDQTADNIADILATVRRHLDMECGFIAEFLGGRRWFRYVDTDRSMPLRIGGSDPLADSYCHHIAEGRMPMLMRDAADDPIAAAMDVTHILPVGAHMSVPIRLTNGQIFGTFCCFSTEPNASLSDRDLDILRMCADLVGHLIEKERHLRLDEEARRRQISDILQRRAVRMVYQPIYRLRDNRLMSVEALARFDIDPPRTPDKVFEDAEMLGMGTELEFLCVQEALIASLALPQIAVALNLSPAAITSVRFGETFDGLPVDRIILEITEHAPIESYAEFNRVLAPYRARGLRLAIDDVGAGHSSFRHVLELKPDLIKLDMSLTRDVDSDPAKQALGEAIIRFSRKLDCEVVAEGVETTAELETLRRIGITKFQGYLTGRPMPLSDLVGVPRSLLLQSA